MGCNVKATCAGGGGGEGGNGKATWEVTLR